MADVKRVVLQLRDHIQNCVCPDLIRGPRSVLHRGGACGACLGALDDDGVGGQVDAPRQRGRGHQHLPPQAAPQQSARRTTASSALLVSEL